MKLNKDEEKNVKSAIIHVNLKLKKKQQLRNNFIKRRSRRPTECLNARIAYSTTFTSFI